MAAIVTDQFRILNASNFIDSVTSGNDSYYVFLGLDNPTSVGFGRTTNWNEDIPNPTDNLEYLSHYRDTSLFGKKITSANIRRLIRKVTWTSNTSYDMYRHDYSIQNPTPNSNSSRLYDSNYYVINRDFRVYICISNGSSATMPKGTKSQDEPTFTDLEPSAAGTSGDGYIWKYLFTVPPADIVKFDSTEYVAVPNEWLNSTENEIKVVRDNGDSTINNNQIKVVSIDEQGEGYAFLSSPVEVDILGDGTGGKVRVQTNTNGQIISATVTAGGQGYSFGRVDLSSINASATKFAKLTPIIPPSRGHGYDLYKELGTDKVLIYSRFDNSSYDFATDTTFAQIGVIKNPIAAGAGSTAVLNTSEFSNTKAIKFTGSSTQQLPTGTKIQQAIPGN